MIGLTKELLSWKAIRLSRKSEPLTSLIFMISLINKIRVISAVSDLSGSDKFESPPVAHSAGLFCGDICLSSWKKADFSVCASPLITLGLCCTEAVKKSI
jgi:hypothetical protein